MKKDYPDWICYECGMKYGRREPGSATWHTGKCDVCGEEKSVTQPRDFGHLEGWWWDKREYQVR